MIRRRPVIEILGVLSKEVGIPLEPSERVPDGLLSARYGPNFGMLGRFPSALDVVSSLNTWFLNSQLPDVNLTFIVEKDRVRIVTPVEANEFWAKWPGNASE